VQEREEQKEQVGRPVSAGKRRIRRASRPVSAGKEKNEKRG
jgi:hypothetical protein